jgi:predicted TIM-barrel fold metal-dependent hydrolase
MIQKLMMVATAAVFAGATPAPTGPEGKPPGFGTYIDVHMHLNNAFSREWVQEETRSTRGPGQSPTRGQKPSLEFTSADYLACADNLVKTMDQYGIRKAVVMPQPRVSGQMGSYDYEELLPAVRKYPDRLILGAGGGILNSMIHGIAPDQVTDGTKKTFEAAAEKMVANGAKAFAELSVLHLSMNPNHVFEAAAADHPLYLLLADIAAKHGVPIDIHMEAVVKDMITPENLCRASARNPSTLKATVPGLERLLQHNRHAKIVWQHMGWDNTGQMSVELLRRMLDVHPNLYLGFKVEDRTTQIGSDAPMPNRMVDERNKLRTEWRSFFIDHADRLLLATDQFVGIPGKTKRFPGYLEETFGAIRQLPEEVLLKVARDNAVRVYNLE